MSKKQDEGPQRDCVLEKVCDARMKALDTKLKYLFGSSIITIALIIVQIARGG